MLCAPCDGLDLHKVYSFNQTSKDNNYVFVANYSKIRLDGASFHFVSFVQQKTDKAKSKTFYSKAVDQFITYPFYKKGPFSYKFYI